jgi:ribosomal protein L24E
MIITASNESRIDDVIKQIETIYPGLTKHRGKVLNYIGMTFDFNKGGCVEMTMEGFVQDLIEGCKDMPGTANTPARANLLSIPDESDSLLPDNLRERFHSITAKLLYLSKRTRPDILTAVVFLTKRVLRPQRDSYDKLIRTLQYVRATQHMGITFEVSESIRVMAYIDTTFAIHPDMKSHTGSVITLGKGAIYAKSGTQRLMTKSSTEAELVALGDSTNQVLWTRNFLQRQGHHQPPATISQDNQSTI